MFKVNKFYLLSFISLLILNVGEGQASAGYEEEKISSGPAAAPPSVTLIVTHKYGKDYNKGFQSSLRVVL